MLTVNYIRQLMRPLIAGCLILITAFAFLHISFATDGSLSSLPTSPNSGFVSPSRYAIFLQNQEAGQQKMTAELANDASRPPRDTFSWDTLRSLFIAMGVSADVTPAMVTFGNALQEPWLILSGNLL